jgi:hypothetical protein
MKLLKATIANLNKIIKNMNGQLTNIVSLGAHLSRRIWILKIKPRWKFSLEVLRLNDLLGQLETYYEV